MENSCILIVYILCKIGKARDLAKVLIRDATVMLTCVCTKQPTVGHCTEWVSLNLNVNHPGCLHICTEASTFRLAEKMENYVVLNKGWVDTIMSAQPTAGPYYNSSFGWQHTTYQSLLGVFRPVL